MTNTKDIIIQLKKIREEKNLSYGDILDLMEKNNEAVSKSTLSRVFAEGSEDNYFSYDGTIRPIANAILDIEDIEDEDNADIKVMKSLLQYKIERIEELEKLLDEEKIRSHEKLDELRAEHKKRIDFLMNQIELKDKRIDALLNAVYTKDTQHKELLDVILSCPARKNGECEV